MKYLKIKPNKMTLRVKHIYTAIEIHIKCVRKIIPRQMLNFTFRLGNTAAITIPMGTVKCSCATTQVGLSSLEIFFLEPSGKMSDG